LKVVQGLEIGCAKGLCPTNVVSLYINITYDMPPNFEKYPNVGPKLKQQKKKRVRASGWD
jgi:hypothetical protein